MSQYESEVSRKSFSQSRLDHSGKRGFQGEAPWNKGDGDTAELSIGLTIDLSACFT